MPSWADAWLAARRSHDPLLMLVTITHAEVETVRLVKNTENVTSRGQVFNASWFTIDWVNDDSNVTKCQFTMPNPSNREIAQRYFQKIVPPEVTLELIAASVPDEPIARVPRLDLRSIQPNPLFVTGTLVGKDHSAEPLGTIYVIPSRFPGFYRRQRKL